MNESRLIIISDCHGMLWKLQELFNKISLRKTDRIIFLGDYIDRGPDSRGVIDYVIGLKSRYDVITLCGNHEEFALDVMKDHNSPMGRSWIMNGGNSCMENYNWDLEEMERVHGDFFKSLKLVHEEENHIFVHGYLKHDLDVSDQNREACLWSRFESIKPHKSGKIVVCGHTIHPNVVDMGYKVCIDTGSFKTDGCITAMIIDGNKTGYIKSN